MRKDTAFSAEQWIRVPKVFFSNRVISGQFVGKFYSTWTEALLKAEVQNFGKDTVCFWASFM